MLRLSNIHSNSLAMPIGYKKVKPERHTSTQTYTDLHKYIDIHAYANVSEKRRSDVEADSRGRRGGCIYTPQRRSYLRLSVCGV